MVIQLLEFVVPDSRPDNRIIFQSQLARPDLVVGHSGFGSTLFLADLYQCPIINYFEWFYGTIGADMDFRDEFPASEIHQLRTRSRNAMLLADLENCDLGYCPTHWQRSRLPEAYQSRLTTIFDGIDTHFWRPCDPDAEIRQIGNRAIPAGTRIVTYVSRGFESMRGFDLFMRVAKRICDVRDDVLFVCIGTDRICYGGDDAHIKHRTFREHVLAQDYYDLDRFIFTGRVPADELVRVLSLSDLHLYWTVPFVLSWSMMDALSCGCTVLASDTAPVREMIRQGENGLLAPFYDTDAFVEQSLAVLDSPKSFRDLGHAGPKMICERYSLDVTLPQMLDYYELAVKQKSGPVDFVSVPHSDKSEIEPRASVRPDWPSSRPKVPSVTLEVSRADAWRAMLNRSEQERAISSVLEIGAWIGGTTRVIAAETEASITCIDAWAPAINGKRHTKWKASLPDVFTQFVANCWEYRDRIRMLSGDPSERMRELDHAGRRPDVICINDDHTVPILHTVRMIRDAFPTAIIIGDNWCWYRVRESLKSIVEADFLELQVENGLWRIWLCLEMP